METNFIQMAASVGYAVAYTIGSIFKHIHQYISPMHHVYCPLKRHLCLACRRNACL